jgi:ubiquinone/menaquinone biosynthesis C-methylase UbiE
MFFHDVDAMPAAIKEAARILKPGGKLCLAIVHPINSAGRFEQKTANAAFVIKGDYLREFRYADAMNGQALR